MKLTRSGRRWSAYTWSLRNSRDLHPTDVDGPEGAARTAFREQIEDAVGERVGGDVVVVGRTTQELVPHAATHEVCRVTRRPEAVEDRLGIRGGHDPAHLTRCHAAAHRCPVAEGLRDAGIRADGSVGRQEQVVPPRLVAGIGEVGRELRVHVAARLVGQAQEAHAGLVGQPPALPMVAVLAGCHEVVPRVSPTPMAWQDVVQRQVPVWRPQYWQAWPSRANTSRRDRRTRVVVRRMRCWSRMMLGAR